VELGLFVTCSIGPDREVAAAGAANAAAAVKPAKIFRILNHPPRRIVSGQ
jgi:hypothetical protein